MQQPDSAGRVIDAVVGTTSWTVGKTVTVGLILIVALAAATAFLIELNGIRKTGGVKEYVKDINAQQYGAIRGIWTCEVVVGGFAVAVILHGVIPGVMKELQLDALIAVLTAALALRGINFGAFWVQRKTEDPVISATNAMIKDPNVMPQVMVNKVTGERSVTPIQNTPAAPPPDADAVVVPPAPQAVVVPLAGSEHRIGFEYTRDE
jgi:hypothetical protein